MIALDAGRACALRARAARTDSARRAARCRRLADALVDRPNATARDHEQASDLMRTWLRLSSESVSRAANGQGLEFVGFGPRGVLYVAPRAHVSVPSLQRATPRPWRSRAPLPRPRAPRRARNDLGNGDDESDADFAALCRNSPLNLPPSLRAARARWLAARAPGVTGTPLAERLREQARADVRVAALEESKA